MIRNAIISFVKESEPELFFGLRNVLIEKDSSFEADIPVPIELIVPKSISQHYDLLTTVYKINLPKGQKTVKSVCLSGERLYTEADETLYVYSVSDLKTPIATYQLGSRCLSCIIDNNYLYHGGENELHIFEVNSSLTQPLIPIKSIKTKGEISKILRVDEELMLGELTGHLEVFDIKKSSITHSH
jgi:hypothetical protein